MWPEATTVDTFLRRVRRRLVLRRAIEGLVAGLLVAAILALARVPPAVAMIVSLVPLAGRVALGDDWRFGWWRSASGIALRAEQATPLGRNLIVTAAELPRDERAYVNDVVMTRAAALSERLDPAGMFPVRWQAAWVVVALAALWLTWIRPGDLPAIRGRRMPDPTRAAIARLTVTITPPAYSGLATTTETNPERIEALAGSRIDIRAEGEAGTVRMETLGGTKDLLRSVRGAFEGSFIASADGFLSLTPYDSAGAPGNRILAGLAVTEDRAPRVTLTSPGRDLFFSNVPGSVPVAISANDDIALNTLTLRYTAVSGSGERFTFVERDVPVTVTRSSKASWTARGTWNLAPLGLAPGDLVVYRALASDTRPGRAPVESESFVIEVVTPGAIAAEGFAADDQRDRYAASQQMVILKTERLLARRSSMARDSVTEEARLLAAEQRQVRAEFVFMMGGELEDLAAEAAGTLELNEVAEAEAEGDVLAGRLQNQGRVDMTRAIRAMSRASTALTETDLGRALRDERSALENLMRAFARSRFILRALTQRERIDLERRLSGTLTLTAGLSGPARTPPPDDLVIGLRRLLTEVAAVSRPGGADQGRRLSDAAMALLRANAESEEIRRLATRAQSVARAPQAAARDSLVDAITSMIQRAAPSSPNVDRAVESDLLQGAMRDARRPRGVR